MKFVAWINKWQWEDIVQENRFILPANEACPPPFPEETPNLQKELPKQHHTFLVVPKLKYRKQVLPYSPNMSAEYTIWVRKKKRITNKAKKHYKKTKIPSGSCKLWEFMCFLSNASASANNFTPPLVKCTCRLQMSCIVQQKIAIEVKLAKHFPGWKNKHTSINNVLHYKDEIMLNSTICHYIQLTT